MILRDPFDGATVAASLSKRILRYSAFGIFSSSVIIAAASFGPLYQYQRQIQEQQLTYALKTRASAIDLHLQNKRAIAQQITSRTVIRQQLEAYNQGEISLVELQIATRDKLLDAVKMSQDVISVSRYAADQSLTIQVGETDLPPIQQLSQQTSADLSIELDLPQVAQSSYLAITAPIVNPQTQAIVGTDVVRFRGRQLKSLVSDTTGLRKTGKIHIIPAEQLTNIGIALDPAKPTALSSAAIADILTSTVTTAPPNSIGLAAPLQMVDYAVILIVEQQAVYLPIYQRLMPILLIILALGGLQTIAMMQLLRPLSNRVLVHSEALETANNQLQAACEQSPVSIVITDPQGKIQYVNAKFREVTGYTEAEVLGQNPRMLQSGATAEASYQDMWSTISHGQTWQGELLNKKKNGELFWESITIAPIRRDDGKITHFVGIKEDITERRKARDLLEYQAQHDPLTDLVNRTYAFENLELILAQASTTQTQVAVLYLDLNGFKQVNDNLGHNEGDQLLQVVARRLQNSLRRSDLVARLGGDEFLIVIKEMVSTADIAAISDKLLQAIAKPIFISQQDIRVSGSLGIALYPEDGHTATELIKRADSAMYIAKREAINTGVFFSSQIQVR